MYNYRQSRMWPFSHRCGIYKVVIRCVQLQTVQDVAFLTPMWYIQGGYQMCTTTDSPGCGLSHTDVVYTRWLSDVYNYRQSRMWPFSHRCDIQGGYQMCTTTDSPGCGLSHTDVIYKVVIRCVQLQTVQDVAFLTPMCIYKVVIRCVQLQTVQDVAFLTPMSYIQGGYQMCTTTDSPGCGLSHTDVIYKVVIRCVQLQTVQDVAFLTPM